MKLMNLKVDGGDDGVADYLANGDYGNVLIMIIYVVGGGGGGGGGGWDS